MIGLTWWQWVICIIVGMIVIAMVYDFFESFAKKNYAKAEMYSAIAKLINNMAISGNNRNIIKAFKEGGEKNNDES